MTWGISASFPHAILHIDGDSFFAACEVAKDPRLRGKPVITGKERGIVSACTYDVKARGVKRGMKLGEARKLCPEAVILPSDYETYSLFSERMYEIVRRYTPAVEEYSIDECFADITGMRRVNKMNYPETALQIKRELDTELGMTFSIGLSATKVLAKIGSKWKKPDGCTAIPLRDAHKFLEKLPICSVWGIGPNTAQYLNKYGVRSIQDLVNKEETWVTAMLSKPYVEIWHELRGEMTYEITTERKESYRSISKTKTFTPPSRDQKFVFSQLSKNIENACIKVRKWDLSTLEIFFFLKTQDFKYHGCEIKLSHHTNLPQDIVRTVAEYFPNVFKKGEFYRATGITLMKLKKHAPVQLDLFGAVHAKEGLKQVFESVDELSEKYGKHVVFLGSSFEAMKFGAHLGERGDLPERATQLFKGGTARRRLAIPSLGEVR
ncbi:MAG: DNA polymerase IV [Parcubacteria group bacterium Gr01-1014_8]|nr:MAG: DNA polymerase IV [Parcubacteria group bacterium Gr01-1014_8]